ncbi:MAG: recombinase family protein [Hyphomicrobiaceae bacterium]|nr:recombinase family protein [Hyphomicrobiaceae bacterium]
MLIGYARTSTSDQEAGLEAQVRDLQAVGAKKIFSEQVSSVAHRVELARALDYLRDHDTLVVTKLDRLARSVKDLLNIVEVIQSKGGHLKILAMDLDTSSSHGRLVLQLLGAIAEFERALMLERQIEGIRRARALGKYCGRKPTARARKEEIVRLLNEGHGATVVARKLGIARSSVYRVASGG